MTVENLLLLTDPAWTATTGEPDPPVEAVIGAWPVASDGSRGRFQPNPAYRPSDPDGPLDPIDALLTKLACREGDPDQLPAALADVLLGLAVDDEGAALVSPAPDGVPALLVTTSYGHRPRVAAPGWVNVTLPELAEQLPGIDVLLNPGAPTSMRVLAEVIRTTIPAGRRP